MIQMAQPIPAPGMLNNFKIVVLATGTPIPLQKHAAFVVVGIQPLQHPHQHQHQYLHQNPHQNSHQHPHQLSALLEAMPLRPTAVTALDAPGGHSLLGQTMHTCPGQMEIVQHVLPGVILHQDVLLLNVEVHWVTAHLG